MHPTPALGGLIVARPTPLVASGKRASQGLALMSDLHLDSSQTDHALVERELKAARRNGDRILIGGDVFDLILPSDRKRYRPSTTHPSMRGRDDLVNAAVELGEATLGPYADLIDLVGLGNHETAAIQHANVDAVRLLVDRLNARRSEHLKPIAQPGYTAFVEYRIREREDGRNAARYVVFFTHGAGKASTAASALKSLSSKTSWVAADLYWSGHSHARVHSTEVMLHAGRNGHAVARDVKCVVTGSYMVAYGHQSEASASRRSPKTNYASSAALAPHGLGGARVVLRWDDGAGFPDRVEVIQ